jgi:hypothetical protein
MKRKTGLLQRGGGESDEGRKRASKSAVEVDFKILHFSLLLRVLLVSRHDPKRAPVSPGLRATMGLFGSLFRLLLCFGGSKLRDDDTATEVEIKCSSKWIAQVIGPGGSKLSELRFMSGAEIHIDKGKEPVTITITGDPKQVKDARQAITQVINDAEHPDYEGEAGKKFRKDADGHAKRAEKLAIEKDALFARGDKENAHRKLDEVKAAQRAMHTSNAAAASAIFENRNKGKGNMYMDFHGLRKTEAIGLLETRTCCAFPKSRRLFTAPGRVHYS